MIQVWTNRDLHGPVNDHQYDIKVTDDSYEMSRSTNPNWTTPGEWVCTLDDHCNGVYIHLDEFDLALDYCQVEVLLAILLASHEGKMEIRQTVTTKSI